MDILVAYDVATDTPDGERRLRRVARECERYGQRVQKSVFECAVNDMQRATLTARLLEHIDEERDSLRIYLLRSPRERYLETHGVDHYTDFGEPLLV